MELIDLLKAREDRKNISVPDTVSTTTLVETASLKEEPRKKSIY